MNFLISIVLLTYGLLGQSLPFPGPGGVAPSGGGFSIISTTSGTGVGGASTLDTTANPITPTGANACFIAVSCFNVVIPTAATCTDSAGNTYTAVGWSNVSTSGVLNAGIFYSKNITVASNQTFSCNLGTGNFASMAVICASGSILTGGADQENDARPSATSSVQAGAVVPTNTNQLVLAAISFDSTANLSSVDSGFTLAVNIPGNGSGSGFQGIGFAYLIQTAATSANPTWTLTGTPGNPAMAQNATFKSH